MKAVEEENTYISRRRRCHFEQNNLFICLKSITIQFISSRIFLA